MPRLLTPASSTDLPARDGTAQLAVSQLPLLALPPPAKMDRQPSDGADGATAAAAGMPSPPLGPGSPTAAVDAFALPPPPTRARTILQVWPDKRVGRGKKAAKSAAAKSTTSTAATNTTTTTTRKTARRTAHSLIERRRRSKMNEAFAALQSLVPACTGAMHKLAVLHASIDYVRYLEGCVAALQARGCAPGWTRVPPEPEPEPEPRTPVADLALDPALEEKSSDDDDGEPMAEDVVVDDDARDDASDALEGMVSNNRPETTDTTDTAPDDAPDRDTAAAAAAAATAALLMLNQDRRGSTGPGRGMRVSDLLST